MCVGGGGGGGGGTGLTKRGCWNDPLSIAI